MLWDRSGFAAMGLRCAPSLKVLHYVKSSNVQPYSSATRCLIFCSKCGSRYTIMAHNMVGFTISDETGPLLYHLQGEVSYHFFI